MKVADMFDHAFDSYIQFAFPSDQLKSVSCQAKYRTSTSRNGAYEDYILGNFSLTLIDALDSLIVFNRTDDFVRYAKYTIDNVSFDKDIEVSLFEVNIRLLGGLLSAHVLQKELSLIPGYRVRTI